MAVLLAFVIIAVACAMITIRNLVGYGDYKPRFKIFVAIVVFVGWFSVLPFYLLKEYDLLPDSMYGFVYHTVHYMLAFMFILFVCLMLRDLVWFVIFRIFKIAGHASWNWDPSNSDKLNKANILVILFTLVFCCYAAWQATKLPNVVEINLSSDKITSSLRIAQISDLHLSRMSSVDRVRDVVSQVNLLNPDVIVLTGDIIDDKIEKITPFLEQLRELSAPYGVFVVMGGQEFHNNVYEAKKAFENNRMTFLFNGGVTIKNANIFISGVPDYSTMSERINLWRTIYKSKKSNYHVLLSHSPLIVEALSKELFDLVLAGHTHGGQFFPVHWFMQKVDHYLAGHYVVNGIDLFVSRGAGTWGPKMRLFAPADVAVFNLKAK